MTAGKQFKFRT